MCRRSCGNRGVGGVVSIAEKAENQKKANLLPRQRLRLGVLRHPLELTILKKWGEKNPLIRISIA